MQLSKILAAALAIWASSAEAVQIDYLGTTYDVVATQLGEPTIAVLLGAGLLVVGFLIPRRLARTPVGLRFRRR